MNTDACITKNENDYITKTITPKKLLSNSTGGFEIEDLTKRPSTTKMNSMIHERRAFENISDQSEVEPKNSLKNFRHLELSNLKKSTDSYSPRLKKRRSLERRSVSVSTPSTQKILPQDKLFSSQEKLMLSSGYSFSARELMQPISSRGTSGRDKYKNLIDNNLNELQSIEEGKETHFNNKFLKKIKKYIKANPDLFHKAPSPIEIDDHAQKFFDNEVNNEIKTSFELKKATSISLIQSELPRASNALIKLQKSAILIQDMISNLKRLQESISTVLNEKKPFYKSKWIQIFFDQLSNLIASYTGKCDEMNPTRTFTYIIENEIDTKMKELISLSLGLDSKELENIIINLNKWASSENLPFLSERVAQLDRKNILNNLNLSTDNITNQKHEWYESLDSKCPLVDNTVEEVIRCLIPDSTIIYSKITINQKTIQWKSSDKNNQASQIQFFTLFLYEIYQAGFDLKVTKQIAAEQALSLVCIHEISDSLKKFLTMDFIPWSLIENELSNYPAIPFLKFKNTYNEALHLQKLNQFLIHLSVPCVDVLKLCINSCWLRGDECIRHLFPSLFIPYGEKKESNNFHTIAESGIECHIRIKNHADYTVTQIKEYGTYPLDLDPLSSGSSSSNKNCNYAKIKFKWSVSSYRDAETNLKYWKGILEIPHVRIGQGASLEIKTQILTILNNPTIVDYVTNSLNGQPKIISSFKNRS